MASIPYSRLHSAIESAFRRSGHVATIVSLRTDVPLRFLVNGPSCESMPLWVYIKNLTPADRADPDEFRIQLSSKIVPLALNPGGPTLLLGYHDALDIFVGFDPQAISTGARTQLSGGYVSLSAAARARRWGMSFDRDRRDRIAVGIRPDMLIPYSIHATEIHAAADEEGITAILGSAAKAFRSTRSSTFVKDLSGFSPERRRLLRSVHMLARDAGFRSRVLMAYGMQCAVSGVQLGLVEAAHILPVCVAGSTDRIQNGLSLLPQYHRAFDSGLIYLTANYEMRINEARVTNLEINGLANGLDLFRGSLGKISLPRHKQHWPDRALIKQANVARGIDV